MKRRSLSIIAILFLTLWAAPEARGQWVRMNGPSGGAINCLIANGMTLLAGTQDSGIFRSMDNGTTWSKVNIGLSGTPRAVLFFTKINSGLATVLAGDRAYLSKSNGESWDTLTKNFNSTEFTGLTSFDNTLLLSGGTSSHRVGGWIYRSTDAGASWSTVFGLGTCPRSLALVGKNVYAGRESDILISTDKGLTWAPSDSGLTTYMYNSVIGGHDSAIFLSTWQAGVNLPMFWSKDAGETWVGVESFVAFPAYALINDGANMFAGTGDGVTFLRAGSTSWVDMNQGIRNISVQSLCLNNGYLFAGTDSSGVWRRPLSDFGQASISPVKTAKSSFTNYPNPFSNQTTVNFTSTESGVAQISIVNLLGAEVAKLYSGELGAGEHSFSWDANGMSAGMYICVVRRNGGVEQVPVMLLR